MASTCSKASVSATTACASHAPHSANPSAAPASAYAAFVPTDDAPASSADAPTANATSAISSVENQRMMKFYGKRKREQATNRAQIITTYFYHTNTPHTYHITYIGAPIIYQIIYNN